MRSQFKFGRRALGYSIAAGVGSLALPGCSPAHKRGDPEIATANPAKTSGIGEEGSRVEQAVADTRQFIDASAFMTLNSAARHLRAGWLVITFPDARSDAMASFTLPVNASVIAVDLIWMAEDNRQGAVRWAGGLAWPENAVRLDSRAASTDWEGAVAPIPAIQQSPVTTHLGQFIVNPDAPCIKLHVTREADSDEDTFDGPAFLLGASIRVVANGPAKVAPAGVLIPNSVRLRGVNISPGPQHFYTDSVWAGLWHTWDWDSWIKPVIDDARSVGANSFRTIGNTLVITSGMISRQEYLDRWRQLLDYTASQGMYFFPCGGDLGHWGPLTSLAAAEDIYSAWSEVLKQYPNIVGVDISNEASTTPRGKRIGYKQPEPWPDVVTRLGGLVREIAQKPITHSRSVVKPDRWGNGSIYTDTISDFISVHCYYTPEVHDADILRASQWGVGKQLLLGEMGTGLDLSSHERVERYRAVKALVEASPDNVGALAWSGYDLKDSSEPRDQKGLFDRNRQPRTDITSEFATFPVSR